MTDDIRIARVRATVASMQTDASDKLGRMWWAFLLRGIFAITLGVFAIFWPHQSLSLLVLAVGIYCVADGIAGLFGALRFPELREYLAQALIVLGIGAVLVFWPGMTLRALLVLLGVAALVVGVGQILGARRLAADDRERTTIMVIGVAAAVVGLVLAFWPGSGIAVISWVIGIAAILIGAILIYLGSRFKRLEARVGSIGSGAGHG